MMADSIKVNYIRLRNKSDNAFSTGLEVWLLPDGGTAPGDLISLTENSNFGGQFDFNSSVVNGKYRVYQGSAGSQTPIMHGTDYEEIEVRRDGKSNFADLNGVLLADQTANYLTDTEKVIDISSYSFTDPQVWLNNKGDYPVYIKTVTTSAVTVGIGQVGSGTTVKFDLYILEA
jgi:hypothetical protein